MLNVQLVARTSCASLRLHGSAVHSDRMQEPTFSVRAFREVKGLQGCITVIARSWALPILGPARMHHLIRVKNIC